MQKINNIVKFVKASYYRLRNIEKLENKIHNFCDKEEKRIEDLIEMAKRKANDYKIHIAESIKTKEEFQEDIYFNSPIVDFAKTDEALRIRTTKQGDEKHIFITYKGAKIDSESKTREEIELSESINEILMFLTSKVAALERINSCNIGNININLSMLLSLKICLNSFCIMNKIVLIF